MADSIHSSNGLLKRFSQGHLYETQDYVSSQENDSSFKSLKILGRVDNAIICGGENIDPNEMTSILNSTHQFEQVFVKGMKHPELGQIPVAFVEPLPTFNSDEEKQEWTSQLKQLFRPLARPKVVMKVPSYSGIKPSFSDFENMYINRGKEEYYDL
jgi:acyl-coenzyme A synthetase/AMP-(fatty) acid ligase